MLMTEQQIHDLITSDKHPVFDGTLNDLVSPYVRMLAQISDRLTREEMADLLVIGAALYERAYDDVKAAMSVEELFGENEGNR